MKTYALTDAPPKETWGFPVVMELITNGKTELTVLFTAPTIGTVIHQRETGRRIGEYSTTWLSALNEALWKVSETPWVISN